MTDDPRSRVYFVGGDVGFIKIGLTIDPQARMKALQCGSPIPLRFMALALGGMWLERYYHRIFDAHRQHGEWFARAPEIEEEIAKLEEGRRVRALGALESMAARQSIALEGFRSHGFPRVMLASEGANTGNEA